MLVWKLRITVLWIAVAVCQSAGAILFLFEPGVIRDLMTGEWPSLNAQSAGVQFGIVSFWLGPMVMAFLTLVLKDVVGRWTNAVVGAVAALSGIFNQFGPLHGTSAAADFVGLVGIFVVLLILWHAWKWPRPTEVAPPQPRQETRAS